MVQAGDHVELSLDLTNYLRFAIISPRCVGGACESVFEKVDEQADGRNISGEHALDVALAERRADLAQVTCIGAKHHRLAPPQSPASDESVESIYRASTLPGREECLFESLGKR